MEKTVRLFDADSYMSSFDAEVLSCDRTEDGYIAVLDRTAFFPEEGGQSCDTGTIAAVRVTKVYETDGVIYHLTEGPVPEGAVSCAIDFDERYRKMQSHTGEHVLCGTAHRLFGCENVGFHLSEEYVRVDLDRYLGEEEVALAEREANRAIRENHAVRAWYPDGDELSSIEYRSKDGVKGDVRLVEIEGVDVCACCAPHVRSTAEIGVLKVVDSAKYKGGTRLSIVCGPDAAALFIKEHEELSTLAKSFSVSRDDLPAAVARLRSELSDVTYRLRRAEREVSRLTLKTLEKTSGALCFFYDGADPETVREFLNGAAGKCLAAAGFIETEGGYSYTVRSDKLDLKALAPAINFAIGGRGGGTSRMIRGVCTADRKTIEEYFQTL